jgi:hypothetical protein
VHAITGRTPVALTHVPRHLRAPFLAHATTSQTLANYQLLARIQSGQRPLLSFAPLQVRAQNVVSLRSHAPLQVIAHNGIVTGRHAVKDVRQNGIGLLLASLGGVGEGVGQVALAAVLAVKHACHEHTSAALRALASQAADLAVVVDLVELENSELDLRTHKTQTAIARRRREKHGAISDVSVCVCVGGGGGAPPQPPQKLPRPGRAPPRPGPGAPPPPPHHKSRLKFEGK